MSPGLAGMRKLQTGKWELEALKVTLQDYPPEVISLVGHPDSTEKPVQLIGGLRAARCPHGDGGHPWPLGVAGGRGMGRRQ